ncbi:hypothetical protein GW17_00059124 [Ensete ventricosum]|nr:hypothetical protein GW17_00059124 [Ensete ventricosum]
MSSHCSDGGYFNALMSFPSNYPNSPPSVRFTSEMWHPNGSFFYPFPSFAAKELDLIAKWFLFLQKEWRDERDVFKKKVRRVVRRSQEML